MLANLPYSVITQLRTPWGEEFVLVMSHASPATVRERAERLRLGVQALKIECDGRSVADPRIDRDPHIPLPGGVCNEPGLPQHAVRLEPPHPDVYDQVGALEGIEERGKGG